MFSLQGSNAPALGSPFFGTREAATPCLCCKLWGSLSEELKSENMFSFPSQSPHTPDYLSQELQPVESHLTCGQL